MTIEEIKKGDSVIYMLKNQAFHRGFDCPVVSVVDVVGDKLQLEFGLFPAYKFRKATYFETILGYAIL